jgi:triosephosphate isomerase
VRHRFDRLGVKTLQFVGFGEGKGSMLHREKLVVGNWKMNGNRAGNATLIGALLAVLGEVRPGSVGVCVPFPYLDQARQLLAGSPVFWAGQDVSDQDHGAFTGQVSASMLAEFECAMTLVGHSERRTLNAESNELVAAKAVRALAAGLRPLVCVGETLAEREAGQTQAVVSRQLGAVLERLDASALERLVLAYEPVWAIGTGKTATSAEAQEVHAELRKRVAAVSQSAAASLPILYGGSVKPGNARELFEMPDIDGGLIGGASLLSQDFLAIVAAIAP